MPDNKGTILLIAVMIMATILTAALGTGTLVINTINQSASIDYSITAYYAAESGIEKNLYRVRQSSFQPIYKDDGTDTDSLTLSDNGILQADYSLTAVNGKDEIVVDLVQNIEYQLNLYDPRKSTTVPLSVAKLEFGGNNSGNEVKLHISWTSWSGSGVQENEAKIIDIPSGALDGVYVNLSSAHLHKVRIKTLNGNLDGIIIKAQDSDGHISIPGIYVLISTGTYPSGRSKQSTQILTVEMPIIEPTYGLYNFVIFSEGDISKSVSW